MTSPFRTPRPSSNRSRCTSTWTSPRSGRAAWSRRLSRQRPTPTPCRTRSAPDTIIVCNFETFRIHSLENEDPANEYVEFQLSELPEQIHLLDFLIDPQNARRKREEKVSLDAGALIGRLYEMLREQYHNPDTPESQHSLNVLCVRLVFCLFAEDAEVFPKDAFYRYLNGLPARQVRVALKELFKYLDTPPESRDPYVSDELKRFPYVNGGLFAADVEIPQFSEETFE